MPKPYGEMDVCLTSRGAWQVNALGLIKAAERLPQEPLACPRRVCMYTLAYTSRGRDWGDCGDSVLVHNHAANAPRNRAQAMRSLFFVLRPSN